MISKTLLFLLDDGRWCSSCKKAPRRSRSRRLGLESLEGRRLLAVGIREFPTPVANSNPFWITPGPGAELYYTAVGASEIQAYNPASHSFTSFTVPGITPSSPSFITTGSDNNLYFTSSGLNAIEQFNPITHVIESFPIPVAKLGPVDITTGPDGNLYFTASNANEILELNLNTHAFTAFPIPTANAGATTITQGPRSGIWFIEGGANKIAELNPTSRVITEFPIPFANSGAIYITSGPEGDLYFTAPNVGDLVQFNPTTRAFAAYPIPAASSAAGAVTAGSDGLIYFTAPGVNEIGQFNPMTHRFKMYAIPTAQSGVTGITDGPDGNVYFTESGANKLGQVLISTGTATTTRLTAAPRTSTVGQFTTLVVTVSASGAGFPTGSVTFFIDGKSRSAVKLTRQDGLARASLSLKLADGSHVITAVYKGRGGFSSSVSNATTVDVLPAPGDGPTVIGLARFGYHAQPTTLVLRFDKPMDPASTQDLANYRIAGPDGKRVRIRSVAYDPSSNAVTISPAQRLDLHQSYRLTAIGIAPSGITDAEGKLLDGALNGYPGSNFVAIVTGGDLKITVQGSEGQGTTRSRPG